MHSRSRKNAHYPLDILINARIFRALCESFLILPLFFIAILARSTHPSHRPITVGCGPDPLINAVYHVRALRQAGYTAESYVDRVYYITNNFDVRFDASVGGLRGVLHEYLLPIRLFLHATMRYRVLLTYFHGGPLRNTVLLWRIEPHLLSIAGIATILIPYGADVQAMDRCPHLPFRHALAQAYPQGRRDRRLITAKIDLWMRHAGHVIAGCDWVDYLPAWDTLTLAHFAIDTDAWCPPHHTPSTTTPFTILHAPNHREIKGTDAVIAAVEDLKKMGIPLDLILIEGQSNDVVQKAIASADIVVDQLIIGWYAMFALESMAMGKPVICYIRPDLRFLYQSIGLLERGEIPLISASPMTIKDVLLDMYTHRHLLPSIGNRGREYVLSHHSLPVIGSIFTNILSSMEIYPHEKGG